MHFRMLSLLVGLLALASTATAQTASVQILHNCADPGAATVDVWVNGERALDDFAFRTATPFIPLPAGVDLTVAITGPDAENADNPVFSTTLNLMADARYAVVASGVLNPANFAPNADPNAAPLGFTLIPVTDVRAAASDMNSVDLFAFHGATDAPAVDVIAGSSTLISALSYGQASSYLSVPAASYVLEVAPTGGSPLVAYTADLENLGGSSLIVVASGFLSPEVNQNGPAFGLFAVTADGGAFIELPPATTQQFAKVQIIHNAADPAAASVDIYLNGSAVLTNFAFRTATPFIDVPANTDLSVGVAPAGSTSAEDVIASFPVNVPVGRYVIIANGVLSPDDFAANPDMRAPSIGFSLYPIGDIRSTSINPGEVDVIAFHGATDAPAVDLWANGSVELTKDLVYGTATGYLSVPAASYTLNVAPAGGAPIANFTADLTTLAGNALVVVASGFLTPDANQNGAAFGLWAATADGGALVELPPVITSVDEETSASASLLASPNPATDNVQLSFDLPTTASVTLSVANATGMVVKSVNLGNLSAGSQRSTLRTDDLASGVYYVTVRAGRYTTIAPVIVAH